ncbi:hypothetical protein U1708_19105 [Sphingomonas sp. ZB1N12]|uniref:hypothetical protein n=1 Tax=Sphingomonas arabinosi TaxID=3096160 RepID=UPI002FC72A5C
MAGDDNSEWLMRGSAAATIIYNDPVWSEQEYAMQRGERLRGDFDPPVPANWVDALRARWSEANALCDRMATEGCDTLPADADPDTWAAIDGDMLIAGRYARDHGIRWVPRALLADYQALLATPLPGSADLAPA